MLTESGEAKAELNLSSSGLEVKAAYVLTDHYVVSGLISAGVGEGEDDNLSTHRYGEGAVGYATRPARNVIIESFAGVGIGTGKGVTRYRTGESTRTRTAEGTYLKPFIQNNIALQTTVFDIGLVNRLSIIQFGSIRSEDEINRSPTTPLFYEPTLFVQLGWDRIKLTSQMGFSGPIAGKPDFDWMFIHAGIGINYRFGF